MFALAYNEGQQQFQDQLNLDNKPTMDIGEVNTGEPNLDGTNPENNNEVAPQQPEPDVRTYCTLYIVRLTLILFFQRQKFQPNKIGSWLFSRA